MGGCRPQKRRDQGRVSIIDTNPRSNKDLKESLEREHKAAANANFIHPTDQRYGERTVVERVNGRLKDEFGARHLRVRGPRLCTKNVRVQVQKIPFVVIYTKACSMGKMFHPKSPTFCHRSR